ncbi:DUF4861 domain-containing protein [Aquimarina sp. AD10]|uniref:DUF4861 family protein n=1 Tax=Aquimarina sp. AD10 TaxID=1714849 RepID=UPI000E4695C7|nr:DUF4861 family protein [Aquimarina sp. AD10]AXT61108.1 DUF4861 domain-containing protein [Aquimarina sp. AD10]RKM92163.1 DUF4861 domain-containing protein [Aquimarina sp. AD10]
MKHHFFILFIACFSLISCQETDTFYTITTVNDTKLKREKETIEIQLKNLPEFSKEEYNNLSIFDTKNNLVLSQLIDIDQDSIQDYIIFQTDFNANETKKFTLTYQKEVQINNKIDLRTFCRIVPERIDDFAWENDKVAFRTYGPKCQQLFEEGKPGGLISSGIDCWTKKVNYPIINKWYANHQKGVSYHEDHGEGLDAYHVGTTRGCGGIALVNNNSYFLSENFVSWKVLANGPIRSIFELKYPPVVIDNMHATETKRITLDLGSNLYHCSVSYKSENTLDTIAIGVTLHKGKGKANSNKAEGWLSYWEPYANSNLGTGVIVTPKSVSNIVLDTIIKEDESLNNIWIHSKLIHQSASYWSGYGWQSAGDFNSAQEWENYLSKQSRLKNNSIKIQISKN